jgi:3-dehydrosphinganine reductase
VSIQISLWTCPPTSTGAHVTIFARRQGPLDEAKAAIAASALSSKQEINSVAIDMADAVKVVLFFLKHSLK